MAITQNAIGASSTRTTTWAEFALGTRMQLDGKEFVYVQAAGAITGDGYVVILDEAFQAALLTTSNDAEGDLVAVADTAFADNEYGWVQIWGPCGIRSEQDALANGLLGATADGGQVDDAAAAGSLMIRGMKFGTATGGADAVNTTGFINYPHITIRPATA